MRKNRIKVRRDRPSALTWALALAVTMLMVYLLTLENAPARKKAGGAPGTEPRVTREIVFAPLSLACVRFGSYETPETARVEAARYVDRGAAGYVLPWEEAYLVLGAGYAQQAEAERVAARLREAERIDCAVLTLEAPRVRLRVTAGEGQIDAVVAADEALRAQGDELEALAFRIDRGELRGHAARTLIAVQAAQVRDVLARLKEIPGGDRVFAGLTGQVEALSAALEVLAHDGGESELALSGRIKYQFLASRIGYIEFLKGL